MISKAARLRFQTRVALAARDFHADCEQAGGRDLWIGQGRDKGAVVKNNAIEPRTMLPIGLSYDHRVIDGAEAARFTVDLLAALENFEEKDVKI